MHHAPPKMTLHPLTPKGGAFVLILVAFLIGEAEKRNRTNLNAVRMSAAGKCLNEPVLNSIDSPRLAI